MTRRISLLGFLLSLFIVLPTTCLGGTVQFLELQSARLPYGEAITITGELADFSTTGQDGKTVAIADWMNINKISVTYTSGGQGSKKAEAQIQDDIWQVSIDALPENAQVSFAFELTGSLATPKAREILDGLTSSEDYRKARSVFFAESKGKTSEDVRQEAQIFLKGLIPVVAKMLPPKLKSLEGAPLEGFTDAQVAALANIHNRVKDLATRNVTTPDGHAVATVAQALEATEKIAAPTDFLPSVIGPEGTFRLVRRFKDDYAVLQEGLAKNISASISVHTSQQQEAGVQDFQKYAGIDVGGIYVPRVESLMSFVTFNIYFGAVEETPSTSKCTPIAKSARRKGRKCDVWDSRFVQFTKQRVSLTFGVAIGDLSSQSSSQIKGTNAFLVGLGFRLNKYFRLTAGDALFRNQFDDKIRHGFFVGPSIDISALPNIRNVFGKVKP